MAWLGIGVVLLLLQAPPGGADMRTWAVQGAGDFAAAELANVQVRGDTLVMLAPLDGRENVALGRAVEIDLGQRQVPLTDGSIAAVVSEWVSGTPNVFGRQFTVDLGMDRAIVRVRVLAGESALSHPEYFMRGYLIETATQDDPDIWHPVAEQRANFALDVDTRADATWQVRDASGDDAPQLGRYVRLGLVRQDRSNWVALGEIEVYATGYVEAGQVAGVLAGVARVNVGRVRWTAQTPSRTQVQVQLREADDEWQTQTQGGLYAGPEPLEELRYRVLLQTAAPFSSPDLRRVEVEYDPVLVAREVLGTVVPDTVRKGVPQPIRYAVALAVEPGNYGVDYLRLEGVALAVDGVSVAGRVLVHDAELAQGFRWHNLPAEEATLIELAPGEEISASAKVEIAGTGLFLQDRSQVRMQVASREQGGRDGYLNWQNGREAPGGSWTVRAMGAPPQAVSKVEVSPQPFSPLHGGEKVEFRFVVGNLQQEGRMVVEIFTLDGRRVGRDEDTGRAREYRLRWNGKDQDGRIASPGLYLYELRVEAGNDAPVRRGTLVVAY